MKGLGKTVMVGTKLEEFGVEVLGVMKDVSPGRDMVLRRLRGLNLEHSGIVQGTSGSPVYVDGKLLGAVAYGWEFAKFASRRLTARSTSPPVGPSPRWNPPV